MHPVQRRISTVVSETSNDTLSVLSPGARNRLCFQGRKLSTHVSLSNQSDPKFISVTHIRLSDEMRFRSEPSTSAAHAAMPPARMASFLAALLLCSRPPPISAVDISAKGGEPQHKTAVTAGCTSDLNCSLTGACVGGVCACDPGWRGPSCASMDLLPVAFPQGYGMDRSRQRDANSSWGATILEDNGTFHMYVNALGDQCLLEAWMRNSRIDHAVSDTAEGPYTFVDTAVNMTSSNPAMIVLPGAGPWRYAMFHIFNGTVNQQQVEHCFPNGSRMPPHDSSQTPARLPPLADRRGTSTVGVRAHRARSTLRAGDGDGEGGGEAPNWADHQISVSTSLSGPWKLLQPVPGDALPRCNNPAPWAHPNGTLYCLCAAVIYRADAITGPWRRVSGLGRSEWPVAWHREDPFLFTTDRGWHLLFHASVPESGPSAGRNCTTTVVSGHMFSEDAFTWHASPISPYTSQVEVQVGSGGDQATEVVTVATRERPKLVFDSHGRMTHLINGVSGVPSCSDSPTGCVNCKYRHWAYTLIQPLRTAA